MGIFYPRDDTPFGPPSRFRYLRRKLRNLLLLAVLVIAGVDLVGEPLIMWRYRFIGSRSNPHIISGTYVGVTGLSEIQAGRYAEGCPYVLFRKPEPSLTSRLLGRQPWRTH